MDKRTAAALALLGASVALVTKWREADADRAAWADATDEVD